MRCHWFIARAPPKKATKAEKRSINQQYMSHSVANDALLLMQIVPGAYLFGSSMLYESNFAAEDTT
jgi:hypothetical protein